MPPPPPPPPPPRETRSVAARLATPDPKTLTGYAAVWDEPAVVREWGVEFTEVIRPGAFARSLAAGADVLCTYNHDVSALLGRTASGTATFREDDTGLFFSVALPDTDTGREVRALAARGDLAGASFVFGVPPGGDRWNSPAFRELIDVDLYEAGPVVTPAYAATSLALRAGGGGRSAPVDVLRRRLALLIRPRG